MNAKNSSFVAAMFAACVGLPSAWAAGGDPNDPGRQPFVNDGPDMAIPLNDWDSKPQEFIANRRHTEKGTTKAATDRATVYRPISVCRVIDTRGLSAAIAIPGPLAPNSTTNVNSAGFCGIPISGVAGLSVSFHVLNLTVNNGGFISFLQQGTPVSGVNAVFNPGASWTAATANISILNDSGNFAIYIAASSVQVIVDVNGYYQDLNQLDVGTQELDINGNTTGDTLGVTNSGSGSALTVGAFGGGTALTISGGPVRAAGAGVNSSTFASIHEVNTAASFGAGGTLCGPSYPAYTVIDNPQANGDANAILLITPRYNGVTGPNVQYEAYYYATGSCVTAANGHWMIHRTDNASHMNGYRFDVLIIKP
jgi:hypothetical protein